MTTRSENLEVEPGEELGGDKKGPYILQNEVGRAIKQMRDKETTRDVDALVDGLETWKKMVSE